MMRAATGAGTASSTIANAPGLLQRERVVVELLRRVAPSGPAP